MTSRELFLFAFRIAESIYRKPGQPVKTEAEIMLEYPDIPAPVSELIHEGIPGERLVANQGKVSVYDCQVLNLKELHES